MFHTSRTRLSLCTAVYFLLASCAVAATPVVASADSTLVFNGSGWGHGIGLSQWGAKGLAEHGTLPNGAVVTGASIAAYYFPGSSVSGLAPSTDKTISVNIDKTANYSSTSPGYNAGYTRTTWTITPGSAGATLAISNNGLTLTSDKGPYTFQGSGTSIVVKDKDGAAVSGSPFSGTVTLTPAGGSPPLSMVVGTSGPFDHSDVRYRGQLRLAASGGKIKLLNRLSMQEYLYGVVPRESPSSWPAAALEAQAIVARSYAYTSSGDMYCTTSSQVYNGHSKIKWDDSVEMHEATSTNTAVDQTLRLYVVYGGSVVRTYFHSTSGGHTANIEDVWLSTSMPSTKYPYYRGVPDPYCDSPTYDPWSTITFTGLAAGKKIAAKISGEPAGAGTTVGVLGLAADRARSGFVRRVDVVWSNGAVTHDVSGDTIRSALGLPSTKFYCGAPFERIAYGDRYATAAAISASAYPAAGVADVAVLVNGTDGKFADALSAASLGGVANGPVLLCMTTILPDSTRYELSRLKPKTVYVIGGPASVSDAVARQAVSAAGLASFIRLGGADRYEVAARTAIEVSSFTPATQAMVASGQKWPDSAIGAVAAAMAGRPLLLVHAGGVPPSTEAALRSLGVTQTAVFGGEATIPAAVITKLCRITGETAPYRRFGMGGTRYSEAAEAAAWCVSEFGASVGRVYIASGEVFPDSVTGGVLAARNRNPMLLTPGKLPAEPAMTFLSARRDAIENVTILGGVGSVSDMTASTLAGCAY